MSALLYGADAVYVGGREMNLRASAQGVDWAELRLLAREAEKLGARIYYCLNSLPLERDLPELPALIEGAAANGAQALIVADPGLVALARRYAPGLPIHLSTQANTTNSASLRFWLEQGVERVNLARELTRPEIASIREACPEAELEVFVQGAMCLAVSGQCLLSAWLNGRAANQGRCTQPCRFEYRAWGAEGFSAENIRTPAAQSGAAARAGGLATGGRIRPDAGPGPEPGGCWHAADEAERAGAVLTLEEALRPGQELWEIRREEPYSAVFAPQDLCLLPYLPWFAATGLDALKVEGRMKSAAYVAQVADVYSTALKRLAAPEGRDAFDPLPYLRELALAAARPLSSGFFLPEGRADVLAEYGLAPGGGAILARLLEPCGPGDSAWAVEVKENWESSQKAEILLPGLKRRALLPGSYAFENHRGEKSGKILCGTTAILRVEGADLKPGLFVRLAE
ncbi:U32 family peptidase [Desulfovibrio sp. OttesenSCG-928-C14]|nr:U32 family peptidase [Desulfovibrio sp. OttesenSCG-928-C14]